MMLCRISISLSNFIPKCTLYLRILIASDPEVEFNKTEVPSAYFVLSGTKLPIPSF